MMSKLSLRSPFAAVSLRNTALAALAVGLTGCVAQVRVAGPPVAYVEPGYVDVQAQRRRHRRCLTICEQPPCPEDGYLWTPGYWGWANGGYYWVPGTWVQPPRVGVLWTPGYVPGLRGRRLCIPCRLLGPPCRLLWRRQLRLRTTWAPVSPAACGWATTSIRYNRAVANINVTVIHNTYNTTVVNNVTVNKVSYNGGAGGIAAAPTPQERQFEHEQHVGATPMQQQHSQQAAQNPGLFARANGGHPAIAATPRPAAFNAPGVVGARGAGPQFGARPPQQPNQTHAAGMTQPAVPKPTAVQKPAQKHAAKKPEKPHPKKKDEKDQGGQSDRVRYRYLIGLAIHDQRIGAGAVRRVVRQIG